MSEVVTKEDVIEAFDEARACAGADGCKKVAEAMCAFYSLSNQNTLEAGTGMIAFYSAPEGTCPNQDQLLCQDKGTI